MLAARPHGESDAIINVLTQENGVRGGLVRGGLSRRNKGLIQPGNKIHVHWRARLADQLGRFEVESLAAYSADYLAMPNRLSGLRSAVDLVRLCLPESEPHPEAFDDLEAMIVALRVDYWLEIYIRWEVAFLRECGYGLNLSCCAATGQTDDLVYVSPKSGRAVSRLAGLPYHDRLLTLPNFLTGTEHNLSDNQQIMQGLALTAYFLEHGPLAHINPQAGATGLPQARVWLAQSVMAAD